ncbi:YkvA family protein [Desulfotomaculum sp. 1211_IL3151]|uniref:YkvA family protein n=1 Tax=Desulfotomaculum sp. 1211_IL3151 TaxID=3084055 RepID=UPI002FDAD4B4
MGKFFPKIYFFLQAMLNPAVPKRYKYETFICFLYFISPIDFVPDFIPLTGKVDDIVIMFWGVKRIFDIVKAHRQFIKYKNTP